MQNEAGAVQERKCGSSDAWAWWERVGRPKTWLAPMVGQSEPAFRMLCRAHGCGMCSTEMIDGKYKAEYVEAV